MNMGQDIQIFVKYGFYKLLQFKAIQCVSACKWLYTMWSIFFPKIPLSTISQKPFKKIYLALKSLEVYPSV